MRTRGNQLLIEALLLIVTTAIVAFTCINLAELVGMFSDAIGDAVARVGFTF